MTQSERRRYLIEYLLKEDRRIYPGKVPQEKEAQENLLRSLMNVRMPKPVDAEFLRIQDAYLQERSVERGITDCALLKAEESDPRLFIWKGDITTLKCDAIVNACNNKMLGCFNPMHACIDNFIHTYAGIQLRLKMDEIMRAQGCDEPTGQAKITSGYNLPARYILHTVGPIIDWKVTKEKENQLADCYRACLELAAEQGAKSIAFCCLSTGVFRFPNQRAAEIAVQTVKNYLETDSRIKQVIFNVFKDEDLVIYKNLLGKGVTRDGSD